MQSRKVTSHTGSEIYVDHHPKVKQHFIAQILLPAKQGASGNISLGFTGTTSDLHMHS